MAGKTQSSSITRKTESTVKPGRSIRASTNFKRQILDSDDINMGSDADDLNVVRDLSSDEPEDLHVSDDEAFDDEPVVTKRPSKRQQAKSVLKEVAIPKPSPSVSGGASGRLLSSQSSSSMSSVLSMSRDRSIGYDTPATSAAVTPAESLGKGLSSKSLRTLARQTLSDPKSATSAKGKCKQEGVDELMEADALLAQVLQEEEYGEEKPKSGRLKRAHVDPVDDSDEESELSDLTQEDPDEVHSPPAKRAKKSARIFIPKRAAYESAKKSITDKLSREVMDTDDSDDTSFAYSDSDLDSLDEIDDDDILSSTRPATVAVAAAADAASMDQHRHSRRGPRRARHRNPERVNNWRRRMQQGMDSRAARERGKLERAHPEILTMWNELKDIPAIVPVQAEQPATITRKLKSFQLEGLDWMMKQEKSKWKGGLLGDEMGMGKTIQAVSLIMSDYPAKEPTLVVVPPVALMQWQNEIKEYTNGKLKVLVYHNTNPKVKQMSMKDLKSNDVIMISYAGLESIYRKESKGWKRDDGLVKENSKIHAIKYHRLILDEAHSIKSRTTGVAKACFALKANYKWCLSGTPVQNRIGEFFSLLRFLQITPFACYFCKSCPCAELHWAQDEKKMCSSCSHSGFSHVSIFNQELLNPITQGTDPDLRREGLNKLRLITDRIMLRRMKRDNTASMELPPKEVIIHNEFFGEIERDFSSSIMSNTTRQFDTYVSRGVMLNNYANIFGLIMQMRQVANHPDLILKKHAEGGQNVLVCNICDETAEEPIRSRCHHEFCRTCAKDYVRSFGEAPPDCPRCHIPLAIDFDQPDIEQDEDHVKKNSIINRIKMEDWTSSTKIEMLVYDLYKLRSKKQTHKSIVFSQFTSMLQLVEWRLRRAGFNTVMLDGSMSPAQRQKSIEYFMTNTDVEVFLVSLKAGGVALNLTEASRVFIIDP